MRWFRWFVLNSAKERQSGEKIHVSPFAFASECENAPSHFEVEFFLEGLFYRYGFEATQQEVVAEWLYRQGKPAKEAMLFQREGPNIKINERHFKEGKSLEERTRPNALFLSVCDQWNGAEAKKIIGWINKFRLISGLSEESFFGITASLLQDPDLHNAVVQLAQFADPTIQDICIEKLSAEELPENISEKDKQRMLEEASSVKTCHRKYDADGKEIGIVKLGMEKASEGTRKFVALIGPLFYAQTEGAVLVIDELEARLHPLLCETLVEIFHHKDAPKNAQIIFTTQNPLLMDSSKMRRDQIWFFNKNEQGASELYTLADFESDKVRPNGKFTKQYMQGIFGAVPKFAGIMEEVADGIQKALQ